MPRKPQSYQDSGVDYDVMDPFKVHAQAVARQTAQNLLPHGLSEVNSSRGESVYLIDSPDAYIAHVEEGLGTKNRVADEVDSKYYYNIAQDTVAMIVNDMICLGALPISVAMHLAVGSSDWFADKQRASSLISGWQKACNRSGAVYAGGETATVGDVLMPGASLLSGSAVGLIRPKRGHITPRIANGDHIVLVASSGVHANGLTLVRRIAERTGYNARLSDGRTFGEAVLDPSIIYVPLIRACQQDRLDLHYAVHITGHGWRKIMRANQKLVYVIDNLPTPQPVFDFIAQSGPVTREEMYGNYNMGAGFALFVDPRISDRVIKLAARCGLNAWVGGHVEHHGDAKRVELRQLGLVYDENSIRVR